MLADRILNPDDEPLVHLCVDRSVRARSSFVPGLQVTQDHFWQRPALESQQDRYERLALPDKPSIAVLPFDNMSGDQEQEFFSDGITEDIITALSKIRWLFVIARNSTFSYKGTSADVRQIAGELRVR